MPGLRDKRVRGLLAIVLLLAIGGAGYQIGLNVWAMRQHDLAVAALDRYDYVAATAHIHSYLKIRPTSPSVRVLAAQAARRRSDFAEAERQLSLAAQHGAAEQDLDLEFELLGVQKGDLRSASRLLRDCQKHPDGPRLAVVLEAIIEGSLAAKNEPLAQTCLELFLKHRPGTIDQAQGLVWRGIITMQRDGVTHALADFRQAVASAPDHYAARIWLVEALILEDPREAFVHLEWMHRHRPDDFTVRFQRARVHRALGQAEHAVHLLDGLLESLPNRVPVLIERARVDLDLNRPTEAERWLRRAESLAPWERDVTLALIACLLRQPDRVEEVNRYQDRLRKLDANAAATKFQAKPLPDR